MNHPISSVAAALALCACLTHADASAKELDQLTDRLLVLRYYAGGYRELRAPSPARVDAVLDARMNELLDQLERSLRDQPPRNLAERDQRVRDVFQHRYLPELVSPYEEWVKHQAHVPLFRVRDKGIYGHAVDYDDARMTWYIELSPIIQISGVLIGLDKLGHFLGQGLHYHEHYRRLESMPEAERYAALRDFGHRTEVGQLGIATGGVYSFADLAANWAGLTFFLALFDDVQLESDTRVRYFTREADGTYRRARDFYWSDWVTSDWDEVLNPAAVAERALFDKISDNLRRTPGARNTRRPSICERYRADPAAYLGPRRALLPRARYTIVESASLAAPYALDVHVICDR